MSENGELSGMKQANGRPMPPVETRFKKGQSGNPSGRPPGALSLKTLIRQVWDEEIVDDKGNRVIRGLLAIKAMADKAEAGDVQAFRALCERLEGLPGQKIDLTARPIVSMPAVRLKNGEELRFDVGSHESLPAPEESESGN